MACAAVKTFARRARRSWRSYVAEPLRSIVQRALGLVSARRPDVYRQIAAALDGVRLDIRAEEHLIFEGVGQRLVEVSEGRRAELRVRTDRDTIRALLAGR